jgi:hypothetical protein
LGFMARVWVEPFVQRRVSRILISIGPPASRENTLSHMSVANSCGCFP